LPGPIALSLVVICEDARMEANQKFSLMGVSNGKIEIPKLENKEDGGQTSFPFSPFCIFAKFTPESEESPTENLLVNMVCEKHDKEHFRSELPLLSIKSENSRVLLMKFPFHPGFHEGKFYYNWSPDNGKSWNLLATTECKYSR